MREIGAMRTERERRSDFGKDQVCRDAQTCHSTLRSEGHDILKNNKTSVLLQSVRFFRAVVRSVRRRNR